MFKICYNLMGTSVKILFQLDIFKTNFPGFSRCLIRQNKENMETKNKKI